MNSIEIRGLSKRLGNFQLGPIDLTVPSGCMVGYIGENGAGKTTTMKLLLGLMKADAGEIRLLGANSDRVSPAFKSRIGHVFNDIGLPGTMTVRQVETFCRCLHRAAWDRASFARYIRRFHLPASQPIQTFSRGMKMQLALTLALSHRAQLLLLDEATSGLDPVVRDEVIGILQEFLQDERRTVLISSHILSDLEKTADYIAFLHRGTLLFHERTDDLREQYALCAPTAAEAAQLDPAAIVGRRSSRFSETLLVRRSMVPQHWPVERPSIEDIMLYVIKGEPS